MRDFQALTSRFDNLFGETFRETRHFAVAACPSDTTLPPSHGVPELLKYWHDDSPEPVEPAAPYLPPSTHFMHLLHGVQE
jgi:hypothetical protein